MIRDLVLGLFRWWENPREHPRGDTALAEDFVFDLAMNPLPKADFVRSVERTGTSWRHVQVLSVVVDEAAGEVALAFRGIDPITELTHRASWFVTVRDGKVARIFTVEGIVPPTDGTYGVDLVGGSVSSEPQVSPARDPHEPESG